MLYAKIACYPVFPELPPDQVLELGFEPYDDEEGVVSRNPDTMVGCRVKKLKLSNSEVDQSPTPSTSEDMDS